MDQGKKVSDTQICERTGAAEEAFFEIFGRVPGTPPDYPDCVDELDGWAASPAGRRELKKRKIKIWWDE